MSAASEQQQVEVVSRLQAELEALEHELDLAQQSMQLLELK